MIGGVGAYGAALSRASSSRAFASYNAQQSINNISSGTAVNFKRNAVTAGIANATRASLAGWNNAISVNRETVNRADTSFATYEQMRTLMLAQRELIVQGVDESMAQSDRNVLIQQINQIRDQLILTSNVFGETGYQIDLENAEEGAFTASSNQIYRINYGPGQDVELNYILVTPEYVSASGGANATTFQTYLTSIDLKLSEAERIEKSDDLTPFGFDSGYALGIGKQLFALNAEIAGNHAEKMSAVLEGAITKLNALDYEAESMRLAKAQQQETMAMSAMQIANQGMQTYVQALSNTSAAVGRLASGRF